MKDLGLSNPLKRSKYFYLCAVLSLRNCRILLSEVSPEVNDGPCWLYAVSSDGLNRWKWVETAGKRVETTALRVEKETLAGLQLY